MKLIYTATGKEVAVGDVAKTFRGEPPVIVVSFKKPHKSNASGKVFVKYSSDGVQMEYYVSVIGAMWINRED